MRAQAERVGQGNAVIQGVGESAGDERYSEFQLQSEALSGPEQQRLRSSLAANASLEADSFNVTTVSASFGEQVARSAIWAILLSLFFVVIYITLRFQWKFSVAVIVAMLHDVLIAIGIYAVVGLEVTTATVAAILTVLGYSIYDTIIILDRIRENIPLMRRSSFQEIANVSLWETIRRSLATTFITLLPITALYFFGGETLKDFAFALLIGIGVRRLLVDLHRGAAADVAEGARAGVREAEGRLHRRAGRRRRCPVGRRRRGGPRARARACGGARAEAGRGRPDDRNRERQRPARAAPPAPQVATPWPSPLAPTATRR